jgi:hypothetical protein
MAKRSELVRDSTHVWTSICKSVNDVWIALFLNQKEKTEASDGKRDLNFELKLSLILQIGIC